MKKRTSSRDYVNDGFQGKKTNNCWASLDPVGALINTGTDLDTTPQSPLSERTSIGFQLFQLFHRNLGLATRAINASSWQTHFFCIVIWPHPNSKAKLRVYRENKCMCIFPQPLNWKYWLYNVKGKKLFSNMKTYIQFSLKLFNFLKSILVSGTERLMAIRGT